MSKLYTWGRATNGRLGNGNTTPDVLVPTQIGSDLDWEIIAVGHTSLSESAHTLAIKNGIGYGFGRDNNGQVGNGSPGADVNSPDIFDNNITVEKIAAGTTHSLAIRNGSLYAFGQNTNYQLGDGTTTTALSPILIGTNNDWTCVAAGSGFSFGIRANKLYSWGSNANGQTAQATTSGTTNTPTQVGTDSNWSFVVCGQNHVLALKTDGTLWGAGKGSGTGRGSNTTNYTTFAQVGSSTNWNYISAGNEYSLAIRNNGELWATGINTNSRLGDGTTNSQTSWIQIGTDTTWETISAGGTHSLGIKNSNLFSWGSATNGKLGNGLITPDVTSPTLIDSANVWLKVEASTSHSVALQSANVAPANTAVPTVSGTAKVGQTLTTTDGTWTGTPTPTYTYQWQVSDNGTSGWSNISGATSSTFTITTSQSGKYIRSQVTATNVAGSATASSAATIQIVENPTVSTPTISGTAKVGQTLTGSASATAGFPAPTISYQWQDSTNSGSTWNNISGATSSTYTLTATEAGKIIRVQATATNSEGSDTKNSTATSAVLQNPSNTVIPTISGTVKVGQILTTTDGTWTGYPTPTYTYQWQVSDDNGSSWSNISGATNSTYTLTASQAGKIIRSKVTGTNSEAAVDAFSSATITVVQNPTNTVIPSISGTIQVGETLTTTNGTWQGYPTPTYTYQWQSSADSGSTWSNISGATNSTYTLTTSQAGKLIRSKVTGTNSETATDAFSNATSAVIELPIISTPTISGIAKVGQTLTASASATAGYPVPSISYQWQISTDSGSTWSNISGATNSTYVLTTTEAGKVARVQATATNSEGSDTKSSTQTATITENPTISTPTISGTAKVGQILTGSASATAGYPSSSLSYQWQSSSNEGVSWSNISGATSTTYTLTATEAGKLIRFQATATNSEGSDTKNSTATSAVLQNPEINQVTISGLPSKVGNTLTASASATAGYPNPSVLYEWFHYDDGDWIFVDDGGSYTPTSADAGLIIKVVAEAVNSEGSDTSEETTEETLWAPANTAIPTITHPNHLEVGETLTADPGTWTGYPDPATVGFDYQWEVSDTGEGDWTEVIGETTDELFLDSSFAEKYVRIKVTATTTAGTADAYSVSTGYISEDPEVIVTPLISGVAEIDETLTCDPGEWGGFPEADFDFQWEKSLNGSTNFIHIVGETTDQIILTENEVSYFIRCSVTATNPVGSATAASNVLGPVLQAPFLIDAPEITGEARLEETISLDIGDWGGFEDPTLDIEISWEISPDGLGDWETIIGADQDTFIIPNDEDYIDHFIRALVDVSNSAGALAEYSNSLGPIDYPLELPTFDHQPSIEGTAQVGEILETDGGAPYGGYPEPSFQIQWQHSSDGLVWDNISGATNSTYTVQNIDLDKVIRVKVTLINLAGTNIDYSEISDEVVPGFAAPTTIEAPEITGSGEVNRPLSSSLGTYAGYPVPTLNENDPIWQYAPTAEGPWKRIKQAQGSLDWTPTEDFVGYYIRTYVTVTNSIGSIVQYSEQNGFEIPFGPIVPRLYIKPQVLPVVNARLMEINGNPENNIGVEYDSEFGAEEIRDATIWHGNADAYLKEKRIKDVSSGQVDYYKDISILIPNLAEVKPGHTLKINYNNIIADYKIKDITEIDLDPGLPSALRCFVVKV